MLTALTVQAAVVSVVDFEMPDYQKEAVDTWRESAEERMRVDDGPQYIRPSDKRSGGPGAGRGYPDISALSYEFSTIVNGEVKYVTGTSAATPVVAGLFSILNHNRQASGKPPLGFLNQLIYQADADTWNDVTNGMNPGCSTHGFHATQGWDPVTGVGTPRMQALRDYIAMME
jgi:tripeptidyl-peptidase-1